MKLDLNRNSLMKEQINAKIVGRLLEATRNLVFNNHNHHQKEFLDELFAGICLEYNLKD